MNQTCPYRLGIYEKALKAQPLPLMFADAARAGYDTFEISLDETDARLERLNWSPSQITETRDAASNQGVQLFSACFSGHRKYALGSADKATEKRAMHLMQKGIEFCWKMGIRVLQITGSDVFYEPHTEETEKRYRDNLAAGVEMASQAGVMLAIEPVEDYITSIRKAMQVVHEVNSPWLQVYPDVANLAAMGFDPVGELELSRGHIVGLHIRDAKPGSSYNISWGSGILDFCAVFKQLRNMNFNCPIIVELWYEQDDDYMQIAVHSREYLIQKYHESVNNKSLSGD